MKWHKNKKFALEDERYTHIIIKSDDLAKLFYHLVRLYHVDDEKLQASLHPTADIVKNISL